REQVAAVRAWQDTSSAAVTAVFTTVRERIAETLKLARAGSGESALATAFDAYLEFEAVERTVQARNAGLAARLEGAFADLRTAAVSSTPEPLAKVERELYTSLEQAERLVADQMSATNLFVQSLMILLREGIEAILIIGALLAFLTKVGAADRRRDIHLGVAAAVLL